MASPLQVSVYTTLLGTDEGTNPVALPEVFSSGGSLNVYIDELGRAKKILGWTVQNSTPIVMNGTGTSAILGWLHAYNTAGAQHIIASVYNFVGEQQLWVSTDLGVTWTFKYNVGGFAGPAAVAQYGSTLYIVHGTPAAKYNGSTIVAVAPTQSPTPTITDSASGQALNGTYSYKLVSVEASGLRHSGSLVSNVAQVQNEAIALNWTADADTNVTGYEIYRTTGTGKVFWFVGYIEGRTTTSYTDNTPDRIVLENRALQEHGDAPPSSGFCTVHKDRMWWLRAGTYTRAYFSDVGLPESVGTNNFLDFAEYDGRQGDITGAIGNFEGRLIVGTQTGIWTVSGTGAVIGGIVDFRKQKTNAQQGWIHQNQVIRVPEGALYRDELGTLHRTEKVTLAYPTFAGDIRIFDGDNDTVISSAVRSSLSDPRTILASFASTLHDEKRGHIIFFFSPTGAHGQQDAVVWNYRYGVWYVWHFPVRINGAVSVGTGTVGQTLLLGGHDTVGRCLKFWNGNSFGGSNINAKWMSGPIYGRLGEDTEGREQSRPALPFTKRWRWVDLILETTMGSTLQIKWYKGQVGDDGDEVAREYVQPSDVALASSQRRIQLKTNDGRFLHDEAVRFSVEDDSTAGSWSLEGFSVGFQVLQGLKRRSD